MLLPLGHLQEQKKTEKVTKKGSKIGKQTAKNGVRKWDQFWKHLGVLS